MTVNAKVDMGCRLREVPGLKFTYQSSWKIRLLQIHGQSLALTGLLKWDQTSRHEFEEIMKGIRLVGINRHPPKLPAVEKSPNFEVYGIRAKRSAARLLYFYDAQTDTVVCTNCVESQDVDIDAAYALSEQIRLFYELNPPLSLFLP